MLDREKHIRWRAQRTFCLKGSTPGSSLEPTNQPLATSKVATPSPRKQRNKQGTLRQEKAKDKMRMLSANNQTSKKNLEGVAGFIENVQDLIARFLAKNRSARSPDSDVRAGLRETSVHEKPSHQGRLLIGNRVSDSVWMRSKRKEGSLHFE